MISQNGARLIAAERARQVCAAGWTPEHDQDHHGQGELALHAAELALAGTDWESPLVGDDDWGLVAKHAGDRQRQLVIAGALIAAEIDRLDRTRGRKLLPPLLDDGWALLSYTGDDGGRLSQVTAAKDWDGIGVIARWTRQPDDSWSCWAADTEGGEEATEPPFSAPPFASADQPEDVTRLLREAHAALGDADDLLADAYPTDAPIRTTLLDVRSRLQRALAGVR